MVQHLICKKKNYIINSQDPPINQYVINIHGNNNNNHKNNTNLKETGKQ